jgi:hypothetical protein
MLVQRHMVLLAWMVAGLLLSQTVYFDRCKSALPLGHCLAASWQLRCRRWLSNAHIDVEALYGPCQASSKTEPLRFKPVAAPE